MSKTTGRGKQERYERAIFTLPPDLLAETRRFAGAFHDGNNSGFVAAAIRSYIEHLKKARHTSRLRESYLAASAQGRKVADSWDAASAEAWSRLEKKRP